ncbi:MAG: response regulator transcription factor [Pseudobdellovibrio sp.]
MNRSKVLIIDDESELREILAEIISERHQTLLARDGAEGLQMAKDKKPHTIILDLNMPNMNGIEVCKKLRSDPDTKNIRIIMLTALNDTEQRIKAFNAGADDFVAKPVHPEELLARLESKLRRVSEALEPVNLSAVTFGVNKSYFLDFERHRLNIEGKTIHLGAIEFRIITALLNNSGQIVKRQELLDSIWDKENSSDRALDPHINALRKKLNLTSFKLQTIYGIGFKLQFNIENGNAFV